MCKTTAKTFEQRDRDRVSVNNQRTQVDSNHQPPKTRKFGCSCRLELMDPSNNEILPRQQRLQWEQKAAQKIALSKEQKAQKNKSYIYFHFFFISFFCFVHFTLIFMVSNENKSNIFYKTRKPQFNSIQCHWPGWIGTH